jgi:molecular chaperone DnaK (HSP70)
MAGRYLIGIDLGTTNTAVAYVDTNAGSALAVFELPQLVAPGEVAQRRQLPSFVYLAGEHDTSAHEIGLPWAADGARAGAQRIVTGELARSQGARLASRMISSAKSWLCHPAVDRTAAILPWGEAGEGTGPKLSPVAAQAAVLAHVRDAWDHAHPAHPMAEQEVVLTVPASFDEVARELTVTAAAKAGLPPVVLLEEPQAAFYAWLDDRRRERALGGGERVLVFDVGGGTTDFTLIDVGAAGGPGADHDGELTRTAVGDHLLLGGDNVDLTLAKLVEARIVAASAQSGAPRKLDALQWHALVHACRLAKEQLLDETVARDVAPIVVQGRGSRLIASTLRDEIRKEELERVLLDGFFPLVDATATPARGRGGLHEFGLPYAADPAITRHLAAFLARHPRDEGSRDSSADNGPATPGQRGRASPLGIDWVLFNGGAMTPASLRRRVLEQIGAWQGEAPRELVSAAPELAVARGAAYYGLVRRGEASPIRGGTARTFYVGAASDAAPLAVCIAPKGLADGTRTTLAHDFELMTNRPVSFRLFSSSSRADAVGALVPIGDGKAETLDDGSDLLELPPIVTVLRARGRGKVTVRLEAHITELGLLELHCVERAEGGSAVGGALVPSRDAPLGTDRWKLEFDMRKGGAASAEVEAGQARGDEPAPHPRLDEAKARMTEAFARGGASLGAVGKDLEALLDGRRDDWSLTTNRALFDALIDLPWARGNVSRDATPNGSPAGQGESSLSLDAEREQRWLHWLGFCLRPGRGAPLDAWRARRMWGVFNEGLAHPRSEPGKLAWWITWRRVGGGLAKGQQEQIYDRLAPLLLPNAKQAKKLAETKASKQELAEMWRTVASLELLSPAQKGKLGDELVSRLAVRKGREEPGHLWALSRLGARAPLYGPLNSVVGARKIAEWLPTLLAGDWPEPEKVAFALAQLGRRTGDRSRDLEEAQRARLAAAVRALPGGERAAVLIEQVVELEAREERVAMGDTLPAGLRLTHAAVEEKPEGGESGA